MNIGNVQTVQSSPKVLKRGTLLFNIWKYKYLYMLLIPGLLWVIIFKYLPMYGVTMAFKDYQLFKGLNASPWVGFENFRQFFGDRYFWPILRNTIVISFYKIAFGFPVPIILALMLNEIGGLKYKKFVQTVIYFPHFLSWVILGGLMMTLLSPQGLINGVFAALGAEPKVWLSEPKYFRGLLVISDIWKEAGWGTVMYLAALTAIDPEIYEAATIDGSTRVQRLWYITLPSILPTIVILLTLRMGHVMEAGFDQTLLLLNSNVREVGEIIDTYVYRVGLEQKQYSYSAAVGLFKSLVNLMFILTTNFLVKKSGQDGVF